MTSKPLPTDYPYHTFSCKDDFETFLDRQHNTAPGIYLKLAKKKSGIPSITAAEAVEVALCFGWIDGWTRGIDEDWWMIRYTPRRSKSIWSQKNVDTVARLVAEGKMRPAGLACVEAAKGDGRWGRAYDGSATITVPKDFEEALGLEPTAKAFFETLSRTDRYSVLWRVQTSSPANRAKKIDAMVQMLATGSVPGRPATSAGTPKTAVADARLGTVKKSKAKAKKAVREPAKATVAPHVEPRRSQRCVPHSRKIGDA
jgi:uncharacterized protein YdeI (YjbR/CyaY-like superfamily)